MLARIEWIAEVPTRHGISGRALGIGRMLRLWQRRIREHEELAAMSERDLRDARLFRSDVLVELRKPFWRG